MTTKTSCSALLLSAFLCFDACAVAAGEGVGSLIPCSVEVSCSDKNSNDPAKNSDGSGFIVQENGYIATSYHIIDGSDKIKVIMYDGAEYSAKLVGKDESSDIALLKIDAPKKFKAITWGDSDKIRAGDQVFAIGNPLGFKNTVTSGIISYKDRHLPGQTEISYLQTDANVNYGNSGGPLFDKNDQLVGMVVIFSTDGASCTGINFAIPSNTLKKVVDQLRNYGKMRRSWLGIWAEPLGKDAATALGIKGDGYVIKEIAYNSPAARACLQVGDIILSINDQDIADSTNFDYLMNTLPIGCVIPIKVLNQGKIVVRSVQVEAVNDDDIFSSFGEKRVRKIPPYKRINALGIGISDLTPGVRRDFNIPDEVDGVFVASVDENSKLSVGDVILKIFHQNSVNSVSEFIKIFNAIEKGNDMAAYVFFTQESDSRYISMPLKREKKPLAQMKISSK